MPIHELVQAAMLSDDRGAWPQHQVKSIAEDDLGTVTRDLFRCDTLDCPVRTDRHECGRLHGTASKGQRAASSCTINRVDIEIHATTSGVMNIESP